MKRKLREEKMHGRQASDERLYLPRSKGGRGIRSMRDLYKETKNTRSMLHGNVKE